MRGAVDHNGREAVNRTESERENRLPQKATRQSFQKNMAHSQIVMLNQSTDIYRVPIIQRVI